MRTLKVVDVSEVVRFNPGRASPVWWGIIGLITIEATVVSMVIVSYLYLAVHADAWPPAGVPPPPLFWPTVNVALLLLSSFTMYIAGQRIRQGNQKMLAVFTSISCALAYLVLALRWQFFDSLPYRWDEHAYGSIVWMILGFHFTHVAATVVGTTVIAILAWRGYFTRLQQIGVIADTMYWYFVAFAWIPLYVTLCWVPRWYGH